jgi:glutamate-1-semialdehyde 2,1-aminomutase
MDFSESMRLVREGARVVPGGVNSNFRLGIAPTPLVFERAEGAYLYDVDGNEFIDYFLGMGPMLLGHRPSSVLDAVQRQLASSILVGGQTPTEYEAASLVVDLVPSADSVRFSSSGSEADQAAIRLARAATGRATILKFEGHYHGWFDNLLWSTAPDPQLAGPADAPVPVAGTLGQLPPRGIEVLGWNDADAVRDRLAKRDVAAVIMEPIMFNSTGVMPLPGYLEAVREACDRTGTLLVFDEVITGFRVSAGGAQEVLGVTPDLTVLGKAIANGFQVAALAGRADVMDLIGGGDVLHGGTYNSQSIAMAATVATLRQISTGEPYSTIAPVGEALMEGLREEFRRAGVEAIVLGYPPAFHVRFGAAEARNYREGLGADRQRYAAFAQALLEQGVRTLPRGTWFLSSAHTMADADRTLAAVRTVLAAG